MNIIRTIFATPIFLLGCLLVNIANLVAGTTFVVAPARRVMPKSTPAAVRKVLIEAAGYIEEEGASG